MGIFNGIVNWFKGLINFDPATAAEDFIKSLAGQLAAGIEAGFLAIFQDLWNVVEGPLLMTVGGIILLLAIFLAVRGDMMVGSIARRV